MKNKNCTITALALFSFAVCATLARAQTAYTPYAVTNFAGGIAGTNDGAGTVAQFTQPEGVAVDIAGNIYVADSGNHTIRMITPGGVVTTLAGTGGQYGVNDGTGSAARFNRPISVAVDGAGNLYVADSGNNKIRKVTPAGVVTTLATGFNRPYGVAVDRATNVYVSDWFTYRIRKITAAGVVTTLAGLANVSGTNDGTATAARFNYPQGLALDSATNLYVGDSGNYTIRKITPAGVVTTLAGSGGQSGTNDGPGSFARFGWPSGVAVDGEGYVYVVDQNNGTLRRINPAGQVTTLAGRPSSGGTPIGATDGIGSVVRFFFPSGLAVDPARNVYVADIENNRIRKGTPAFLFERGVSGLSASNGVFHTRLAWPFATNVVVEASADFQTWSPIQTNAHPPGSQDVFLPLDTNQNQFFRARLSP